MKRILAVVSVGVAFTASAAIAVAQNSENVGEEKAVAVQVTLPDSLEGRGKAFERAKELDRSQAPPDAKPGPVIESDEIHIPDERPLPFFVQHCEEVAAEGEKGLDREPLCRAVLLMDARSLSEGVYAKNAIEVRYERVAKTEVAK